jgi:hypothetical protein
MIEIDKEIEREILCIDDLTVEISMLARKGETDKAYQRNKDLHFSLKQLEKLHRQKELWEKVADLNRKGILVQVVKKHAHQA